MLCHRPATLLICTLVLLLLTTLAHADFKAGEDAYERGDYEVALNYEAGEKPIPPGIENQIHPKITTQDDVLALLGEPVARMMEGSVHVFTYSF